MTRLVAVLSASLFVALVGCSDSEKELGSPGDGSTASAASGDTSTAKPARDERPPKLAARGNLNTLGP